MDINAVDRNVQDLHAPTLASPLDKAAENRDVVQAVKALNGAELFGDNELMFQRDAATKRMVVQVVNRQTKEVISQVPAEYVLRLADDVKPQGPTPTAG